MPRDSSNSKYSNGNNDKDKNRDKSGSNTDYGAKQEKRCKEMGSAVRLSLRMAIKGMKYEE